uniref:Uncharacterized protein n=1 Tax=Anopheles arabiensis TaxID=7173 RepID=A0A182HYZ1_ANOAR
MKTFTRVDENSKTLYTVLAILHFNQIHRAIYGNAYYNCNPIVEISRMINWNEDCV